MLIWEADYWYLLIRKEAEKTKTTRRIPAWENQQMCVMFVIWRSTHQQHQHHQHSLSEDLPLLFRNPTNLIPTDIGFATLCLCSSCNDTKTLIGDVSGYNCKMNISTKAESSGITEKKKKQLKNGRSQQPIPSIHWQTRLTKLCIREVSSKKFSKIAQN